MEGKWHEHVHTSFLFASQCLFCHFCDGANPQSHRQSFSRHTKFKSNEVVLSPIDIIRVSMNRASADFFPPPPQNWGETVGNWGLLCVNVNCATGNCGTPRLDTGYPACQISSQITVMLEELQPLRSARVVSIYTAQDVSPGYACWHDTVSTHWSTNQSWYVNTTQASTTPSPHV